MKVVAVWRILFLSLLFLPACGSNELPYTDNSQDPEAYARDVKTLVAQSVRQAKTSTEPLELLTLVLSELKKTDRPAGKYKPTYEELRKNLEAMITEFEQVGKRPKNFAERLDDLVKLIQLLPGDTSTI